MIVGGGNLQNAERRRAKYDDRAVLFNNEKLTASKHEWNLRQANTNETNHKQTRLKLTAIKHE